jgi:nicotinamide riboside kinase
MAINKIALVGAGGTGKTYLAKKLSELLNIPFIESPTRKVAANYDFKHCNSIYEADPFIQMAFQTDLFNAVVKNEERNSFIADRSVWDVIAYMKLYNLPERYICYHINKAINHCNNYDLLPTDWECLLFCRPYRIFLFGHNGSNMTGDSYCCIVLR